MKIYTDLKQSKALAKILSIESADMKYKEYISSLDYSSKHCDVPSIGYPHSKDIPCWSLAALLGLFPHYEINNNGVNIQLSVKGEALITEKGECLLDLAVNMIIHLHELKMF